MNGLIIQWGVARNVSSNSNVTVNLPIQYSNPNYSINLTAMVDGGSGYASAGSILVRRTPSVSSFVVGTLVNQFSWFTIGY